MAIKTEKSRGKTLTLVEGKVEAVWINAIPTDKIKTYNGPKGAWTPTHRYSVVVDGTRVSLGMGDKDGVSDKQQLRVKDVDDKYVNLVKGLEVSIDVDEGEPYQGKPQYGSSVGRVVVTDASGAEAPAKAPAASGGASAPYKPKDMTGVSVGHSMNGAFNFLITWGIEASNENIIRYATSVHNVTEKLKKSQAEKFPKLSEYDIGASVGNSVLNAVKLVGTDGDFEAGVEGIAQDLLDNVVPVIEKYVREGKGAPAAPKVTRAAAPKKAATKVTSKAAEPEPDTGSDDMDDDLPF